MDSFRVFARANFGEDFDLAHFDAVDHILLCDNEYALGVRNRDRIRVKGINSAHKFGPLVVPEMYVVAGILRVES